ncbi:class I SAM-dependent methyltransferase [Luteimonas sp. MJ204]|uniref:class I SAM-dependent methyltransferase n=1 Tax=Luteimonas sp. MJ145 TaxID=3129234 RepID=UPI0031BB5C8C
MHRDVNAQYNRANRGSITDRVSTHMRRKMYARFIGCGVQAEDTILDVGVTSDQDQLASNYLEAWHPHGERITACGIDDASFLEQLYPGLKFVRGDGKCLPFRSGSFDWVHSSAVLEHVGSSVEQARFIAELHRVCRKGVFATTPNRWFPVEFHTVLPLVHWLPKRWFRTLLRALGHRELALEEHLNLMGRSDLAKACTHAGLLDWRIDSVSLGGWPSNLLLLARKHGSGDQDATGDVAAHER